MPPSLSSSGERGHPLFDFVFLVRGEASVLFRECRILTQWIAYGGNIILVFSNNWYHEMHTSVNSLAIRLENNLVLIQWDNLFALEMIDVMINCEHWIPSSLQYKTHFSGQLNCWSFRRSWSIACRRCSNYIFILNLTSGFNGLGKDNYQMRREAFKFWDLVRLILETLRYLYFYASMSASQKYPLYLHRSITRLHICNHICHCTIMNGVGNQSSPL